MRRRKWIAPLVTPAYCLLLKGLILDGRAGIYYTFQRTYAEILLSLRLLERELSAKRGSGAKAPAQSESA
jgi:hypothetical protein